MQGNLPGRANSDYSWAFLLHQPLHAHRISAFPAIRFIWTIAIQPARMCEKIPSSPEDALVHTVLSLSSEACGKSPCSSILFAAFSRPYNSPSEICQAYFCLGCFAHSKGDGASPQKPQLRSGLATNILLPRLLPIPCTYKLYARKNYRQDISHFIWASLDEPLGG